MLKINQLKLPIDHTEDDFLAKIRKQLKKLRDERNSHTKRIHAIDDEIVTLEESLATVVEQNRIIRKKTLEEESISLAALILFCSTNFLGVVPIISLNMCENLDSLKIHIFA